MAQVFGFEHVVDGTAQLIDRLFEPFEFGVHVFGDESRHVDARLMHDGMTKRDAFGKGRGCNVERTALRLGRPVKLLKIDEIARRHNFGQHHRDRLQRLDFFFGVIALGAVLHRQHADNATGPQHRHAHQRLVNFFARFRTIGETRMRLRIGQIQRPRMRSDVADQTFTDPQTRLVNGGGFQTFGGKEFKLQRRAHQIDRTHFGDHVGSDEHDDHVETLLRRDLFGHDLAQFAQQNAGAPDCARHQISFLTATVTRSPPFVACLSGYWSPYDLFAV